jgi:hypothetical protein
VRKGYTGKCGAIAACGLIGKITSGLIEFSQPSGLNTMIVRLLNNIFLIALTTLLVSCAQTKQQASSTKVNPEGCGEHAFEQLSLPKLLPITGIYGYFDFPVENSGIELQITEEPKPAIVRVISIKRKFGEISFWQWIETKDYCLFIDTNHVFHFKSAPPLAPITSVNYFWPKESVSIGKINKITINNHIFETVPLDYQLNNKIGHCISFQGETAERTKEGRIEQILGWLCALKQRHPAPQALEIALNHLRIDGFSLLSPKGYAVLPTPLDIGTMPVPQ